MKKAFLFITLLSLTMSLFSQELTIKDSFREDLNDLSALTNQVSDNNYAPCALIKIDLNDPTATFSGSVIRSDYKQDEWWVYMKGGSNRLEIKTSNNATKVIEFEALEGGITYKVGFVVNAKPNNVQYTSGSSTSENLSREDFDQVTTEIRRTVRIFQGYVKDLAGNSFTREQKAGKYREALKLCIGRGEPYDIIVPTPYGEETQLHEAVKMGIFPSKSSKKRVYMPMKNYLYKLITNDKYKKVEIECSNAIRIDNFRKVGDGRYVALAHYLQKYSGYNNELAYWDYTSKTVTVYINRIEVDLPDGGVGHHWQILLGDVDCDDVWG